MRAALVITGSELLTGFRQDALVQPFCAQLLSRSITVQEVRLLGDDPETLLETLPSLCAGLELIVITGGLGRTPDDTTREVIERLLPQALSIEDLANPVGAERGFHFHVASKAGWWEITDGLPQYPAERPL